MRDILSEIWSTAKRNKLRTALTGFAVAWGIFMLIFLLGAGNGLIHATEQNSNQFLANSMEVEGGETSKAYKGFKEGHGVVLNDKDFALTQHHFAQNIDEMGAQASEGPLNIMTSIMHNNVRLWCCPISMQKSLFRMAYSNLLGRQSM